MHLLYYVSTCNMNMCFHLDLLQSAVHLDRWCLRSWKKLIKTPVRHAEIRQQNAKIWRILQLRLLKWFEQFGQNTLELPQGLR